MLVLPIFMPCPELSLRQQEQQLMESIERLNSQLNCKWQPFAPM